MYRCIDAYDAYTYCIYIYVLEKIGPLNSCSPQAATIKKFDLDFDSDTDFDIIDTEIFFDTVTEEGI